jgi:PleD family two-component response regulator
VTDGASGGAAGPAPPEVLDRGSGLSAVDRERCRSQRTGRPMAVAVIGVETLPGGDGDDASDDDRGLGAVGTTLRSRVRPYDVLVRLDRAAYLVAMVETDAEAARDRLTDLTLAVGLRTGRSIGWGLAELRPDEEVQAVTERAGADLVARRRRAGAPPRVREGAR